MSDEKTTKDREGYARVFYKNNGGYGDVAARCYNDLLTAWKKGEAFFPACDVWGDPMTIKLGEVAGIGLATLEGLERFRVDEAIEEERRKSRELLSGE